MSRTCRALDMVRAVLTQRQWEKEGNYVDLWEIVSAIEKQNETINVSKGRRNKISGNRR